MPLTQPTASDVRVIFLALPATTPDAIVESFITDAAAIVEQCSGVATLASAVQASIIKYVAAHLLSQIYGGGGQVTSETLGDASKSYAVTASPPGLGLMASHYGRQALLLDSTGCLAKIGKQRPVFQPISSY